MKKYFIMVFLLIIITACSNSHPVIVKKETPPKNPNTNPELVEQQIDDDEEADEFIEFPLEDEVVMVQLNLVPILENYLQATNNREKIIEKMNLQRVHQTEDNSVYLLEFSCNNNSCSYLLLDQSKENSGHLVADLAKIVKVKLSPDYSKLLLHFNRETSLPLPLSNIVIVDLEEWNSITLENSTNDIQVLNYSWPILSVDWNDPETISVTIPDIFEPTIESIDQWQSNLKGTMNVILTTQQE